MTDARSQTAQSPTAEPKPDEAPDDCEEYAQLLLHNEHFDRWESMTDDERGAEIKWAIR